MNDKINKELIKIQDELSTLDNTVLQIEKAGVTASELIKTIREVQEKYSIHLEFVQNKVDELLEKSGKNAEEKLEEIRNIFIDYHNETIKSQQSNIDLIDLTIKRSDDQINAITSKHEQQIEDVSKLMNGYMDLAKSSATLNQEIQEVDFPIRLQNLENAAKQLNKVQIQLKNDIEAVDDTEQEILKKLKKQSRRSGISLVLNILIFIIVLGVGIEVMFHYFPEIMEMMKEYTN
ncbi:MAG: hypothetical protein DRI95_02920 [Bacteroidetes bacterium]|nr:MAG: hypothetical protein DRI95_02920 [Bacteroidota bacterium]